MSWQVVVDFDGTISREDTIDLLLERFGLPGWEAIEAEWVAGRIGSRECMAQQIDLIRATPDEMQRFIDSIEIDRHFYNFIRVCERYKLPVTIASDGVDLIIDAVLKRTGLGHLPVVANHLQHLAQDRWRLSSPHAADNCSSLSGTCKCQVGRKGNKALTLVIGDGRSDRCAASEADFVFAKSSLVAFCRENSLPFQIFSDFAEATSLLGALILSSPADQQALLALKESHNG